MNPTEDILEELHGKVKALLHDPALDAADTETAELLDLTLGAHADGEGSAELAAAEVLPLLRRLQRAPYPWASVLTAQLERHLAIRGTPDERPIAHRLEVGRRMLATHYFMEGMAPSLADFGAVRVLDDGHIQLGLGLDTQDGSLQRFLMSFARRGDFDAPRLTLRPFFDVEADALAKHIHEGVDAVGEYLRSQLVFKYDAHRRRVIAQLPDAWLTRFERLAFSLPARRLQLELSAGARLVAARSFAERFHLESLRGLALAFDIQPFLGQLHQAHLHTSHSEHDRISSLAENVLERVHGSAFQHWSQRVQAIVEGQGHVAQRFYREDDLLGPNAIDQPWRFSRERALIDSPSDDPLAVPIPGHDYIVQPEDQLSRIARNAYEGKADFRYLLEHNPHVRSPANIRAGIQIYIPQWPPQKLTSALDQLVRERVMPRAEGDTVVLPGRKLGPFPDPDEEARVDTIVSRLSELFADDLLTAQASELPEGWAVLIQGRVVIPLIDADLEVARALFYEDSTTLLESWAKQLAAELRGDVMLGPDHFVACGFRVSEPNRRRWLRASLRRAILDDTLHEITVRSHDEGLSFEVIDATGCALAKLVQEDFDAMRKRFGRRLSDLELEPLRLRKQLMRLWLSDLRRDRAEIIVPPVKQMRKFQVEPREHALELLVPMGTQVFSAAPGIVVECRSSLSGHEVLIDHGHGLFSRFRHLATLLVRVGQELDAESPMGRSGLNSDSREPSLTLEMERRLSGHRGWTDPEAKPASPIDLFGTLTQPLGCTLRLEVTG